MNKKTKNATIVAFLTTVIGVSATTLSSISFTSAVLQAQDAQSVIARRLGAIKAINGNAITLTPDSGPEVAVTIQPNARLLSIAPGEKDLKNATPIQLQDLHVGDRIRVRGTASADSASIAALEVIVIPTAVVAAVGEQMRQDWQKRGLGGLVSAVDPAAGTVTISISSFGSKKVVVVHTTKSTILHRYAPDSAKPEDAKPITLQDVHIGDQLRARGDRSADGGELAAEEIYAGNFPNVDGLIKSIDASTGILIVQDAVSKKTVQLKINADSQLHKIPAEMAQRFAQRVKAALPPGTPGAGGNSGAGANAHAASGAPPLGGTGQGGAGQGSMGQGGASQGGATTGGASGGGRSGGGFDLQRLLDQTPAITLADLHKGDAVAILATEGTPSGGSTVIKLFSGVEPILQAAPSASQAMMLAPWSLGGAPGGDAGP
jgi:Domain of unknown function (DUF5666)